MNGERRMLRYPSLIEKWRFCYMIRYAIKNIVLVVGLFFSITSCTDDKLADEKTGTVEEGIPVSVDFSFQVEKTVTQSRAAQSINTEYKVNNLYVFAFYGDGRLDNKRLYQLSELENTEEKQDNGSGKTQGTIPDFRIHTGSSKTFYAVANVGYSGLNASAFDAVETLEDLQVVTSDLPTITSLDRTFFLMSGQLATDAGQTSFDVTSTTTSIGGTFLLKRTDARITFKVTGQAANSNWTNFSFEPRSYRVVNIPRRTYVFPHESDAEGEYGRMTQTLSFEALEDGTGFEFYLQENRQTPKKRITEEALTGENANATLFAMREEWDETDEETGEKIFEFAPEHGTYVEIKGLLSYEQEVEGSTQFVSADVTYTIHLGNTGSADEADLRANNYETLRNTHYTYTVKVRGVDDIIVEVKNDEKRPGAEGDVVIAGGEVVELDSHFDRYKFYLRKSDLLATADDKVLTWAISTPFENAMRIQGNNELPHDYKWITFAINKEYGVDNDSYVKYPGDDIYDGYGNATPSETGTYEEPHYTGYTIPPANDGKIALRDVEQLLNFLTEEAKKSSSDLFENYNGENDVVVVTAFVDEYLYVADPTDPNETSTPENPTPEGLLLWKKVVNGRDRMLHICRGAGQTSTDGNSSVIRSVLSFRQHPIHTIYDVSQPDDKLYKAWGTEMIMETGKLAASFNHPHADKEPYDNTTDNGRINQLNFVTDVTKYWTEIISTNERYGLRNEDGEVNHNTIWHACMLRNRDINGDNIIQEREVRWYLAAIDQLSALWIGDASINESARTYPADANGNRYHIASSSYWGGKDGNSTNPTILWAEEGASIGDYDYSNHGDGVGYNPVPRELYAYRCVRNLGIALGDELSVIPQNYVDFDKETMTVDLSLLGYASKRTASDNGNALPEHHERNTNNRPYEKFEISTEVFSRYQERKGGYWVEGHWEDWQWIPGHWVDAYWEDVNKSWKKFHDLLYPDEGSGENPCPEGFRPPNQREMAIMLTIQKIKNQLDSEGRIFIVPTSFSMNGSGNYDSGDRYGFLYNSNSTERTYILETGEKNYGGTRCVRDVVE